MKNKLSMPVQDVQHEQKQFPAEAHVQPKLRLRKRGIMFCLVCFCGVILLVWVTVKGTASDPYVMHTGNVQRVVQTTSGGGIIFPYQQLVISYPVAEHVVAVLVKPGDSVKQNQPLMQLDPAQLSVQIKQAASDLATTQAYLNAVSAGSTITVAQAQQEYDRAKNRYNALVAQQSSVTLHNNNLITPMDGVVTAVTINSNEVFAANTPLVTIMDESKVIVRVKISLASLQRVKLGQIAFVTPSALPSKNVTGVVSAIIPSADPQTDTFEVWVEIVNTNNVLLPGMSAFARIQV